VEAGRVVRIAYARLDGAAGERDVEPLCLAFWGHSWTLGAWCRRRKDFRNFRVDRITELAMIDDPVSTDPARGLAAYLEAVGAAPDMAD
jgi:predicted DNA-binding transcriptional regulator YafY